jgi:hypothetical protein
MNNHVVECEQDRRIGWEPEAGAPAEERAGMDNGNVWIESMAKTLERLDALFARPGEVPPML